MLRGATKHNLATLVYKDVTFIGDSESCSYHSFLLQCLRVDLTQSAIHSQQPLIGIAIRLGSIDLAHMGDIPRTGDAL